MSDEGEPPNTRNLPQLVEELHGFIHAIAIPASKTTKNVPVPKTTFEQLVALVDAMKVSLPPLPTPDVQTLSEKLDRVLAAIQEPHSTKDSSPTYAAVAALKTPKQRPAAHNGFPKRNRSLDFTLVQKDRTNPVFAGATSIDLLIKVNQALLAHNVRCNDEDVKARAVGHHASGDIFITAHNREEYEAILDEITNWLPTFSEQLTYRFRTFPIVVHRMPKTFPVHDPTNPLYIRFIRENEDLMGSAEDVDRIEWINPKGLEGKTYSSIVVHLRDSDSANHCIEQSVCFQGRMLPCEKSRRFPSQCYRCQRFGHLALHCKSPPSCANCANAHPTRNCPCPAEPPCRDTKSCKHVTSKCTLCRGPHRASDKKCPERLKTERAFLATDEDYLYPPGLAY